MHFTLETLFHAGDKIISTIGNYKKTKYKKNRKSYINDPERLSIHDRPISMDDYHTPGHYEIDTIFSSGKGGVLTLNHRATAKLYAIIIPDRTSETVVKALKHLIKRHNLNIKTITSDNGHEFAK